jgi:signal transduction histidine kinase
VCDDCPAFSALGEVRRITIVGILDKQPCLRHETSVSRIRKTIVDDVLSFSKLDSSMLDLRPQACQPEQQLRSTLKMFHAEFREYNIDYEFRVDPAYRKLGVD